MKETAKYKELLNTELEKLEGELSTIAVKDSTGDWIPKKNESDTDIDESDRDTVADGIEEYSNNIGILEALEIRYQEILRALKKISDGEYGICEKCNQEIDEKRLLANPSAITCVNCPK